MNRLTKTFGIFILVQVCACTLGDNTFQGAKEMIKNGNYKSAVRVLSKIIEKTPTFDSAYIERANAYCRLGETDRALKDYNHVISNPFVKKAALGGRAILYYSLGKYEESISDFSQIIKLDANNYHAYYGRGMAKTQLLINGVNPVSGQLRLYDENGKPCYYDYSWALNDYNKSIAINDSFLESRLRRGDLFREMQNNQSAFEDYDKAIKMDSDCYDAYHGRALIYMNIGDSKRALGEFDRAIQIDPKNPISYVNRGLLKTQQLNDSEGACEDFKMAESLGMELTQDEKKGCK